MRYTMAAVEREAINIVCRSYFADVLYYAAQGKAVDKRLTEILDPPKEETRSASEIISKIKSGLGGQT